MGLQALLADVPNRRLVLLRPQQADNAMFSQKELSDVTKFAKVFSNNIKLY